MRHAGWSNYRGALLLVWSCWLTGAGCTPSADPEPLWGEALVREIDALAEEMIRAGDAAGISIGVRRGDDVLLARGYGYSNLEDSMPATVETIYQIGSITKQFTAAAVLQLVEAGAVSLDDPLTDYLPDYPTQGHHLTLRHLLTHTSGIKNVTDPDVIGRLTAAERAHDPSNDELRALFQDWPLAFAPGERFSYDNSGYLLLGMVVEAASGVSYRDYAADRLFSPLGLTHSSYCDNLPAAPSHAHGYEGEFGEFAHPPYISMHYPGGAGALCSTVLDLLTWSSALRSGRAVSSESYEQMITPTVLFRGDTVPYGFGLELDPRRGQPVVSHGGGMEGFESHLAYYPDADLDVVVLTNTRGPHAGELARAIANWALDPAPERTPR